MSVKNISINESVQNSSNQNKFQNTLTLVSTDGQYTVDTVNNGNDPRDLLKKARKSNARLSPEEEIKLSKDPMCAAKYIKTFKIAKTYNANSASDVALLNSVKSSADAKSYMADVLFSKIQIDLESLYFEKLIFQDIVSLQEQKEYVFKRLEDQLKESNHSRRSEVEPYLKAVLSARFDMIEKAELPRFSNMFQLDQVIHFLIQYSRLDDDFKKSIKDYNSAKSGFFSKYTSKAKNIALKDAGTLIDDMLRDARIRDYTHAKPAEQPKAPAVEEKPAPVATPEEAKPADEPKAAAPEPAKVPMIYRPNADDVNAANDIAKFIQSAFYSGSESLLTNLGYTHRVEVKAEFTTLGKLKIRISNPTVLDRSAEQTYLRNFLYPNDIPLTIKFDGNDIILTSDYKPDDVKDAIVREFFNLPKLDENGRLSHESTEKLLAKANFTHQRLSNEEEALLFKTNSLGLLKTYISKYIFINGVDLAKTGDVELLKGLKQNGLNYRIYVTQSHVEDFIQKTNELEYKTQDDGKIVKTGEGKKMSVALYNAFPELYSAFPELEENYNKMWEDPNNPRKTKEKSNELPKSKYSQYNISEDISTVSQEKPAKYMASVPNAASVADKATPINDEKITPQDVKTNGASFKFWQSVIDGETNHVVSAYDVRKRIAYIKNQLGSTETNSDNAHDNALKAQLAGLMALLMETGSDRDFIRQMENWEKAQQRGFTGVEDGQLCAHHYAIKSNPESWKTRDREGHIKALEHEMRIRKISLSDYQDYVGRIVISKMVENAGSENAKGDKSKIVTASSMYPFASQAFPNKPKTENSANDNAPKESHAPKPKPSSGGKISDYFNPDQYYDYKTGFGPKNEDDLVKLLFPGAEGMPVKGATSGYFYDPSSKQMVSATSGKTIAIDFDAPIPGQDLSKTQGPTQWPTQTQTVENVRTVKTGPTTNEIELFSSHAVQVPAIPVSLEDLLAKNVNGYEQMTQADKNKVLDFVIFNNSNRSQLFALKLQLDEAVKEGNTSRAQSIREALFKQKLHTGLFVVPNARVQVDVTPVKTVAETAQVETPVASVDIIPGVDTEGTEAIQRALANAGIDAEVKKVNGETRIYPKSEKDVDAIRLYVGQSTQSALPVRDKAGNPTKDQQTVIAISNEDANRLSANQISQEIADVENKMKQIEEELNRQAAEHKKNEQRWEEQYQASKAKKLPDQPAPVDAEAKAPFIGVDYTADQDGLKKVTTMPGSADESTAKGTSTPEDPVAKAATQTASKWQKRDSQMTIGAMYVAGADHLAAWMNYKIKGDTERADFHFNQAVQIIGTTAATQVTMKAIGSALPGPAGAAVKSMIRVKQMANAFDGAINGKSSWTLFFTTAGVSITDIWVSNTSGLAGEVATAVEIKAMKALGVPEKDLPPYGVPTQLLLAVGSGESGCQKLFMTVLEKGEQELDKYMRNIAAQNGTTITK